MNVKKLEKLGGWGNVPHADCDAIRPEKMSSLAAFGEHCLARGQGKSYGDSALLSDGTLILTERLNRFMHFDVESGLLLAEAGLTLAELHQVTVPQGWFVPVTPGTAMCSLGGCFASDVHGKNHHVAGSFASHVRALRLVLADGSNLICEPNGENSDIFWATAGGMGLTGIIAEIEIQLQPITTGYMAVKHHRAHNLNQMLETLTSESFADVYSVAWIDCLAGGSALGRGVCMTGHHAAQHEFPLKKPVNELRYLESKRKGIPFDFPGFVLNPLTLKLANSLYGMIQGSRKSFMAPIEKYFYPLDGIQNWNRMYGKSGFVQYQFVVPHAAAKEGVPKILKRLSDAKAASFLSVLKTMGKANRGILSFPMEGITLALDLPFRAGTIELLHELDAMVLDHGGRVYLAKDSCLKPDAFKKMYPNFSDLLTVKAKLDPTNIFTSDQAKRLELLP